MVATPSYRAVCPFALVVVVTVLASGCKPQEKEQAQARTAQLERGRLLLAQYQCGSCHTIPDVQAARGRTGPTLVAFGRRSYIAGQVPNRPEPLARWLVAPAAVVPGTTMPAMGVSPDDARDMAAYLLALE